MPNTQAKYQSLDFRHDLVVWVDSKFVPEKQRKCGSLDFSLGLVVSG